jgi:hypothetical protein
MEKTNVNRLSWENLKERDHLEDLGLDGIILRWNYKARGAASLLRI